MPWSAWITSAPTSFGSGLLKASYNRSSALANNANADPDGAAAAAYADALVGAGFTFTTGVFGRGYDLSTGLEPGVTTPLDPADAGVVVATIDQLVRWYNLSILGDVSGIRDWFPPELFALTEGVDYIGRPDRTPADQDYYVQYEAGTTVFSSWLGQGSVAFDVTSTSGGSARGAFAVNDPPPETPADEGNVVAATPQIEPTGTTALFGATGGGSSGLVDFSASLTGRTSFGIVVMTDLLPYANAQWVVTQYVNIQALYQYPRWRYWIPGETYLRNFARTDGLGGNAPRNFKKTSVQGSLRNFGYR